MSPQDVSQFHAGNHRLFKTLIVEHSPRLLAVALRLRGDSLAAQELVHDTWVHAFERRHSFAARGSFLGWMLALLRTCHLQAHRENARRHAQAEALHREVAANPSCSDAESESRIDHDKLLQALGRLGERQRDVVVMRVLEGRTVAQTATQLDMAEGTVKATLWQALRRLRLLLQEDV